MGEKTIQQLQSLPNPYVGPRPFTAAERDRFFGREQEANQRFGVADLAPLDHPLQLSTVEGAYF
jgi:hypothetical protein